MSFDFKWPKFSPSFYDHAKHLLSTALNKGEKPPIIADKIQVNHLDMGTIPPDLEILEIGDLGRDRFRGIFRMTYAGDASIRLQTKVQANPLRQQTSTSTPDILTTPSILFASTPLIVPMTLSLSSLKLRAIVVLVISRLEGVTLVFKNDPLESVQVSSSFDSLTAIQSFLQTEIERQLRDLFRTELPGIIHQLSRQWLKSNNPDDQSQVRVQLPPCSSIISRLPPTPLPVTQAASDSNPILSVPDEIESYDPTYGLRPSHPHLVGSFTRYRSLVKQKNRQIGLGVVLAPTEDDEEDELKRQSLTNDTPIDQPVTPVPQNHLKTTYDGIELRKIAKPKICHSHSVGLLTSDISSSGLLSHLSHQGTRSSSRAMGSSDWTQLNDLQDIVPDEHQREEAWRPRRRLEPFSIHSPSASLNALPTLSLAREKRDIKGAIPTRMSTSPSTLLRTKSATRPSSSIFPSTQRSSVTGLPPYASHCGSPVPAHYRSPIFLSSRSTTATEEEVGHDELDQVDLDEHGSSCALLASLVRGNWTLSPFSRSISHFAARSTPLGGGNLKSSHSFRVSSPARFLSSHPQVFNATDEPRGFHPSHPRSCWLDSSPHGFKQKRVTKIRT